MKEESSQYRGRFAPSPSGPLHFGSLVAALGSYLDARSHRGEWLLRMEDIDPPREKKGAADDILRTLESFGFEWAGEVLYQSRRHEAYNEALVRLASAQRIYACKCSRKEVAAAGLQGVDGPLYPGSCRGTPPFGRWKAALRLHTEERVVRFKDGVFGIHRQNIANDVGDFVIKRIDGVFAYQLAVVMDDAYQGVTHVVRGADLLHSTPRQIYLQQLFDFTTPLYTHLPLVLNEQGEKLSKQAGDLPVDKLNPIPTLIAALKFLNQPLPDERPESVTDFWHWATGNWHQERITPNCQGD
ncbi:MAG: tRNA glutamyl-Q(34) synthetase GluQRS [Candidatus Sedimenticola sp. (ex Thyasira tokunagai)]